MRRAAPALATAVGLLAGAPIALGVPESGDRPAGHVFSWSHELNQNELRSWREGRPAPIPERRWNRIVRGTLRAAGRSGLWFSGPSALPFPPLPLPPQEPTRWRNPRTFAAEYRATGLRWDVSYEVWAARNALSRKTAIVNNPRTEAHARRVSLIDPGYRREALSEIRRIVPRHRGRPYVHAYQGSDEPIVFLPSGRRAVASAYGRRLRREVRRRHGVAPPAWNAPRRSSARERLRWLAFSRYVGDRFFALKAEQARLIRRLDPRAVVIPSDYAFISGFMPWDYTRLSGFADIVEADPYVSFPERDRVGRGRYNPGFAAKLMHDLTGRRVRIIVQAFPHARYSPRPAELWTWSAQALAGGATDLSFFASQNPRFVDRRLWDTMLAIASSLRGTRLPAHPLDPEHVVVYATASEGQAQPHRDGGERYRTSGDALYTTHSLLGPFNGAAFAFDADVRLVREPERLARARAVWLPRADTLDAAFAARLEAWVRSGGTLIVTDPAAFTRTSKGGSLAGVRSALIGAPLAGRHLGSILELDAGALAPDTPSELLSVPIETAPARSFAGVPADATVVARFLDGAPAAILRRVGAGRVLAFSADPMAPAALEDPLDLVRAVRAIHAWAGGILDHPAWSYRIPGDPLPRRLPWTTAVRPEEHGGTGAGLLP